MAEAGGVAGGSCGWVVAGALSVERARSERAATSLPAGAAGHGGCERVRLLPGSRTSLPGGLREGPAAPGLPDLPPWESWRALTAERKTVFCSLTWSWGGI